MFGDRLKEIRKQKGLKQSVLAKKVGTSQTMISLYETNKFEPTVITLECLCDVLGVTATELLGF